MNKDNQAAIKMVKNNQITERSKHVNIGCHFVRECAENQNIKLRYYHTDKMTVDGYTKRLSRDKFQSFVELLGMRTYNSEAAFATILTEAPRRLSSN